MALDKDTPLGWAVQRSGVIGAIPILSGLHHHYVPDMIFGKDRCKNPLHPSEIGANILQNRRIIMALSPWYPATRYEPSPLVDLSTKAERERLSPAAIKAFLNIMAKWRVRDEDGVGLRRLADLLERVEILRHQHQVHHVGRRFVMRAVADLKQAQNPRPGESRDPPFSLRDGG